MLQALSPPPLVAQQQAADLRVRGMDGDVDGGDVQITDPLQFPPAEVGEGNVVAHEEGQAGIVVLKI